MNRWPEFLVLTGTERKVAIFLVGAFIVGTGIRLYRETFPDEKQFEYRSSDSTFAVLSAAPESEESGDSVSGKPHGPVNINTATKEQLMTLPGIGEVTAERIILRREDVGPFTNAGELRSIKGISKKKFDKLKDMITVR